MQVYAEAANRMLRNSGMLKGAHYARCSRELCEANAVHCSAPATHFMLETQPEQQSCDA